MELWELLNAVVYAYSCLQTSCVDIDENSSVLSVRNLQLHCRLLAMALHSLFLAPFQHLHPLLIPPSSIKVPEMHELDEKHLLEAQITRIIAKFDVSFAIFHGNKRGCCPIQNKTPAITGIICAFQVLRKTYLIGTVRQICFNLVTKKFRA